MRKIVFLLMASLLIAFTACNKEKINTVNPEDVTVNLNKAELQKRIEILNYPVAINHLKDGLPTPIPELWAIARILPDVRSYSVFHWEGTDANMNYWQRTTATNDAPTVTVPATPDHPSADLTLTYVSEELFEETLSITGAGLLPGGPTPDFAYFTSHIRGDVFGGEVFAVKYNDNNSIDNSSALIAEVSIFDNTADYNDLTIDRTADPFTLWIAGDNNARGAIVRNIKLWGPDGLNAFLSWPIDSPLDTADIQQAIAKTLKEYHMPLLGPSGNSVTIPQFDHPNTSTDETQQLWVVAGGTSYGGLVVMDKNDATRLYTRTDVHNAKHFDMGNKSNGSGLYGAFLWGDGNFNNNKSNLRVFNTSIGPYAYTDYLASGPFGLNQLPAPSDYGDVTFEGKNAIDVDGTNGNQFIYMAMGADGIKKVNPTNGLVVDSYNLTGGQYPSTFGGNGLANGLVVHENHVYVAWGASGLLIFDKFNLAAGPVGQYNGIGSCNYVAVDTAPPSVTYKSGESVAPKDDILWAGFGTGGMVMLKFVNNVGN